MFLYDLIRFNKNIIYLLKKHNIHWTCRELLKKDDLANGLKIAIFSSSIINFE